MRKGRTSIVGLKNFWCFLRIMSACTAGKIMAYGKGNMAERFLREGLKYNSTEFYFHYTTHNFSENIEIKNKVEKDKEDTSNELRHGLATVRPGPGPDLSQGPSPGSEPKKVFTPGSSPSADQVDSFDEDDEGLFV